MIEIYLKSNNDYERNGDITLDPISCTYKDSENLLTLEHFFDEEGRYKYIAYENVIAAEENNIKKLYRIYEIEKSLYSIIAHARPLFFDLLDTVLIDTRPTSKTGQEALNIILQGTGFTGYSNITNLNTAYYVRKNVVESIVGDDENSFLNRWGGETYFENKKVYVNDRIGSDKGLRVSFGLNLNEIEENINIEEVVTRIIPVGFDGIMLDGNSPWVDSPLINKYTKPKMRVIEFSDIKVKENADDEEGFNTLSEARAELIRQANLLFESGIDKPSVNYKIDMINLDNTTEYEGYEMLVEVNKGDTVTCYVEHLDIDVKARVIDYERDMITGEYISIELGNIVENFFNKQADMQTTLNKITNNNGTIKAGEIQGVINAIQTQFKALRDIAQPQDVRAILFEDRIEGSPTFGCMVLGTVGFEIASGFKPGTNDWDFRTFGTGQGFVADCIIAGILMSRNGVSWLDLDNGTFDFANGNLGFDGTNLTMIGKIINVLNGFGVELDKGGLMLATNGEVVGGIRSSRFSSETNINGISIVNTRDGDYIDIGFTENEDFDGSAQLTPIIRIAKIVNELLGNFKGIQLFDNVRLANTKKLFFESNNNNFPHEIYNTSEGNLALFGDNGILLGYRNGEERVTVFSVDEQDAAVGIHANIYENLNMNEKKILGVSDIFTGTTAHRYHHDGWCGSTESTAKRISNLNMFYDSGWYAFGAGSNGSPTAWGMLQHFKWSASDFAQLVIGTDNKIYTRWWVNDTWTAWVQR